jgi:hypothetical protein
MTVHVTICSIDTDDGYESQQQEHSVGQEQQHCSIDERHGYAHVACFFLLFIAIVGILRSAFASIETQIDQDKRKIR